MNIYDYRWQAFFFAPTDDVQDSFRYIFTFKTALSSVYTLYPKRVPSSAAPADATGLDTLGD